MKIITISRQYGSGGDEIASRVCEILGYKEFNKRLISQAAQEAGLSEQEVIDYSEENHKIRGFLDRLFSRSQPIARTRIWKEDSTGTRVLEEMDLTDESAVALVRKAIHSAHQEGSLVILGRGGQVILKNEPDCLHIRIEAPLEERLQRVKQQLKQTKEVFLADVDIRREAQDLILQRDEVSRDYLDRFYNVDWSDPSLYHAVLNTGKLTIEQAAKSIVHMAQILQLEQAAEGRSLPMVR